MPSQRHSESGIVNVPSKYSVSEALQRLDALVKSRGLTVFAHIDFSGDGAKVGLRMRASFLRLLGFEGRHASFSLPSLGRGSN